MKRHFTTVLLLMVVAVLLRGMTAVGADLCGVLHAASLHHAAHELGDEGDAPHAASQRGDPGHSEEGSCSHCAACSVGTLVVFDASGIIVAFARPGAVPIPFPDRPVPAGIAERLDRPPITL